MPAWAPSRLANHSIVEPTTALTTGIAHDQVRKPDGVQRLTYERAEARCVTTVRSLGVRAAAVQPQLQQLLVAVGPLARRNPVPALANGAWRTQDNATHHVFSVWELKGKYKKTMCYILVNK